MIGLASFNGPPDAEGMVEISYAIAPGYTSRGYATAAARLLIAHAPASGAVRTVRAHTAPAENASARILGSAVSNEGNDRRSRRWVDLALGAADFMSEHDIQPLAADRIDAVAALFQKQLAEHDVQRSPEELVAA